MFKVQLALPPIAKLALRSKGLTDAAKLEAVAAKATDGGIMMNALVRSAIKAKEIQRTMDFGTVILDIDYSLTPMVRMCFLTEVISRDVEAYYMGCGHQMRNVDMMTCLDPDLERRR